MISQASNLQRPRLLVDNILNEPLTVPALLCIINGVAGKAADGIESAGVVSSLVTTFGVSAIVWLALWLGILLLLDAESRPWSKIDVLTTFVAIAACVLPWGIASWFGLTLISLRLINTTVARSTAHRAGWVLFGACVPLLWSKIIFSLFSTSILKFDAFLVSEALRTARDGNMVSLPNGTGYLRIAAACSSFANISLVIPLWTTLTQYKNLEYRWQRLIWPGSAVAAIVLINVTRISLIGMFPDYYHIIHGDVGQFIVNILLVVVTFYLCLKGVQIEARDYFGPERGGAGNIRLSENNTIGANQRQI